MDYWISLQSLIRFSAEANSVQWLLSIVTRWIQGLNLKLCLVPFYFEKIIIVLEIYYFINTRDCSRVTW